MKKVIILGVKGYIGTALEQYLIQKEYEVASVDTMDASWKDVDFSGYDVMVNVAGIAHQKETKDNQELYYRVNTDLAVEAAHLAKKQGVGFYIYISSMSVYGIKEGEIDQHTPLAPQGHYASSKAMAEIALRKEGIPLAIVRPPMVYGRGAKGNFPKLVKLVQKTPLFPDIENRRSMIYIENLCCFLQKLIEKGQPGIYCPQNQEYVSTKTLVNEIAKNLNIKLKFTKFFNPFLKKISKTGKGHFGKLFADLYYNQTLSNSIIADYADIDFPTSIRYSLGWDDKKA